MRSFLLFFASLLLCSIAYAQIQMGPDFIGNTSSEQGISLSQDGSVLAVGSPNNNYVKVYKWSWTSRTWMQLGANIIGEAPQDRFGYSVSLSNNGTRLAVGATLNDGNASYAGHTRIYEYDGISWIQLGSDIDGDVDHDNFGFSVSLSGDGNKVAIGCPNCQKGIHAAYNRPGKTRVFQWNGTNWSQMGSDIDGEDNGDESGNSVSLSNDGNRIAIGAPDNQGALPAYQNQGGHTRVFEWDGSGWNQLGTDIDGDMNYGRLGRSVSLSNNGNIVALGSTNSFYNSYSEVYSWNGNAWVQVGTRIWGGNNTEFGRSVALTSDGSTLAIGAALNGNGAGLTKVYKWNGTNWYATDNDIHGNAGSWWGTSVSMSGNGRVLAGSGYFGNVVSVFDLSSHNPDSAYTNNRGCVVCNQYAPGDTFSLDSGATWYTAVDRPLLETMRDNGDDLSKVCVSLVNNMSNMFKNESTFNQDIGNWDVSDVTDMFSMFNSADAFNQDIGNWDVSSVTNMSFMFRNADAFNQNIGSWEVSNVTDMSYMFSNCDSFNVDIGDWNVSSVTNMNSMFSSAFSFSQDLSGWCMLKITSPPSAFAYQSALTPAQIPFWGTCSMQQVINPKNAFINQRGCVVCDQYAVADSFSLDSGASWYTVVDSALLVQKRDNGADLTKVCVSLVDNMSQLFLSNVSFNQDISGWDVSNVTDMSVMFGFATAFNQDIGNWDVGNVNEMSLMFYGASAFDQDLSGWCVSNVPSLPVNFSTSSPLSTAHYPSWGTCPCILTLDLGPSTVSVCDTSYVLDAGYGYSSYLWSTGDTTQSIQVNTNGNYSCMVSDGNCSASDTVYVSLLYAPISASDSLVCAGDLVTLTAGTLPNTVISQLGLDIDGEAAGDYSGQSVSLSADGQTVAIGASGNDGNGSDAGHVRIYSFSGSSWTQLGQDIDGEAGMDHSGDCVSLSSDGQTVAIGARYNDGNGSSSYFNYGHVRIYSFNGSSWNQIGQDIDGEAAYDNFSTSVSLSADGQTVAIGAYLNDGNGSDAGHVRIYSYNGSSWTQVGQDIDGEAAGDRSGWSVSLSADGQTVAIGAYLNDGNGSDAGHVRIYFFNGSSWSQLGQDIDGEAAGDESSYHISLSANGQTVAIGAPHNDGNGANSGHVRIYSYDGWSWRQVGQDIDGVASNHYWSSNTLSADGSTLAIGSKAGASAILDSLPSVRIYSLNSNVWMQLGQDIYNEATADAAGWNVSLSANGKALAVGAPYNDGNGSLSGHVRVYGLSSASPLNYLWSTGDTTQSISVSPTQPTTYFCTISDGNGSCMDSVFIDMPISVDSILALDANKGVYKAYFSGLDPSLSYDLQFKSVSDTVWRSKTIHYPGSGQQKFNIVPLYSDSIDVRIIEVAGEEGCISSLVTPCKNMNLQLVEQKSAFCAGDSALVRVGIAGGYGAKSILWSNGATTKRTYAQQGETLSVTVTDASGCSLTDSITASTLSTATSPTGLTITRFGAIISAQWNASTLSSNQTLLGYKLNFRLRNTQTWTKSALISGTSTVLNWTGSGIPAGNYEFVVFARYRENGVAMNSNFSCITVKGYNGVGGKSDISDASDNSHGAVPTAVYPNPADDFLYVQTALGSEMRLLDMQGKMITQMISTELETTLDLSALAQGVYMLEIHSQGRKTTEPVVKR